MSATHYRLALIKVLLMLGLLSSCQSQRVAFRFQPQPAAPASAPDARLGQSDTAANAKLVSAARLRPDGFHPVHPHTASTAQQLVRATKTHRIRPVVRMSIRSVQSALRSAAWRRSTSRPASTSSDDGKDTLYVFLFALLGVIFTIGGIGYLLVALVTLSGALAINGLQTLGLGLLFLALGWLGAFVSSDSKKGTR